MDNVRVAILGGGFSADFRHEVYRRLPGVEVVALMGRTADRAREDASRLGIPHSAGTFDDLLAGPEFDAVDICLPNYLHHTYAALAAKSKKHIICAKPLARNAAEAQEMLDIAEAEGVIHCYGENWVFSPDMREIEDIITKGVIGRPLWMRGREGHAGPHSRWFYEKRLSGGGALLDMGCHVVGAINKFCGRRATEVFCHASTLQHDTDCDDNAIAVVKYEGGMTGQVEASWTARGGMAVLFEVWGDEGTITYDRSGPSQPIKVFSAGGTERYFMEKAESKRGWLFPMVEEFWRYGYYDELTHFVECFRSRKTPSLTFRDGLEVNRIIDAAYRSAETGKWEQVQGS